MLLCPRRPCQYLSFCRISSRNIQSAYHAAFRKSLGATPSLFQVPSCHNTRRIPHIAIFLFQNHLPSRSSQALQSFSLYNNSSVFHLQSTPFSFDAQWGANLPQIFSTTFFTQNQCNDVLTHLHPNDGAVKVVVAVQFIVLLDFRPVVGGSRGGNPGRAPARRRYCSRRRRRRW